MRLPEAQIMLRHPQNSGLQMDQLTRLYVPPFFIENLKIWQGDELVVTMDGGIAISEDPNIRFNYKPNGAANFRVEAVDTSKERVQGRMADREIDALVGIRFERHIGLRNSEFPLPPARGGIPAAPALACSVDRNSEPTGPVTWDIERMVSAVT